MKKIINKFTELIKKCDLKDIESIFKCHLSMCKIIEEDKTIEINTINKNIETINKLIKTNTCNNCDKCNNCEKIKIFKPFIAFIEYKNKIIIKSISYVDSYKTLTDTIKKNYKTKFNIDISDDIVKNGINYLLLKNIKEFNGNWNIIQCNSKGIPKKIDIIDPEDLSYIYDYIKLRNIK